MTKQIMLTPEELEDIKDTAKFRAIVYAELKQLRGVKDRLVKIEVSSVFQWFFTSCIIFAIIAKAMGKW